MGYVEFLPALAGRRQTERQAATQAGRQAGRETGRQRGKQACLSLYACLAEGGREGGREGGKEDIILIMLYPLLIIFIMQRRMHDCKRCSLQEV